MSKFSDFSEKSEQNMNFTLSCFPNLDYTSRKSEQNQKNKEKFFEVFHKKKIIYLNENKKSNSKENQIQNVQYKCIYCGNIFNSMNRFEAHMRMHVRKNNI